MNMNLQMSKASSSQARWSRLSTHTKKDDWSVSGSHLGCIELLEAVIIVFQKSSGAPVHTFRDIHTYIYSSLIFCRVGDVNLLVQLTDRKTVTQARKPVRRCKCFFHRGLACTWCNSFVTVLIGRSIPQLVHRKPLEFTVMYRVFGDVAVITQFCSLFLEMNDHALDICKLPMMQHRDGAMDGLSGC
jgi:hypothetical protein